MTTSRWTGELLDSQDAFKARLAVHGLTNQWPHLRDLGYTTMSLFGGAQGYWPQCPDPAVQPAFRRYVVLPAAGKHPNDTKTGAICARLRRLFLECYTELCTNLILGPPHHAEFHADLLVRAPAQSALVDCAYLLSLPAQEEERLDLDAHFLCVIPPVTRRR